MITEESGYLDFKSIFYANEKYFDPDLTGMAYAYSEVNCPDDRKVKLTLGSNDGAKLWVNGEVIYNEHVGRGAVADQVLLDVNFKKGTNKILAKVENLGANWGLYIRLVDPKKEINNK